VIFLFEFPQFPLSIVYYLILVTSHIRRIASCLKSYLWIGNGGSNKDSDSNDNNNDNDNAREDSNGNEEDSG
jgi:hypothetical protein